VNCTAVVVTHEGGSGAAGDFRLERHVGGKHDRRRDDEPRDEPAIDDRPGAQQAAGLAPGLRLRGVDDEAPVPELLHDMIAGIDAACATDALELVAVPDVDAGGADVDAEIARDTAAVDLRIRAAPRLTPARLIGDLQRMVVGHHALETGVGAQVDAELLAEPGKVEKRDRRHDAGEGIAGAAGVPGPEGARVAEISHE